MQPSPSAWKNVRDFGAVGGGATLQHEAINRTIAACHRDGGGTVLVPAGIYLIGTVDLLSNVTLHLEAGAVLKGSPNLADYRALPYASELRNTMLILADGATNVALTGRGAIDGNADAFARYGEADTSRDFEARHTRQGEAYLKINDDSSDGPVKHKPRPGILILLRQCRDVLVRDVRLLNAPNWCLHVACSEDVLLTGLEIRSSLLMPNSGGLDVSLTRNVRISDCNIEAGDDAIAFSPCADGFGTGTAENIVVQNCVLLSRSAAIRIGWGLHDFRNLLFNNIVIRDTNRGIVLNVRHGETIEHVTFSNILIETRLYKGKWWGKGEPIHISAVKERQDEARPRAVRNVTFSHVSATGDHGVVIYGEGDGAIEAVTFDHCRLTLRPSALQESFGGNFDLRPFWDPSRKVFKHDVPALFARGVKRLALRNLDVVRAEGLPDFCRHALEIEQFEDVVIDGFRARRTPTTAGAEAVEIVLRDGREAVVRHAKAAAGRLLHADRVDEFHDETTRTL